MNIYQANDSIAVKLKPEGKSENWDFATIYVRDGDVFKSMKLIEITSSKIRFSICSKKELRDNPQYKITVTNKELEEVNFDLVFNKLTCTVNNVAVLIEGIKKRKKPKK